VVAAVNAGTLDRGHYENFVKLTQESKRGALTPAEKKKKERAFGRLSKAAQKDR
jgi:hypothetical protein